MRINQGFAAGGAGYVRAVFSHRARGHAAPVDLLRAVLRGVITCGMIRRVRADFAGYLVTESDIAAFSESRKNYTLRRIGVMCTGWQLESYFGGDLDAPEWILAGSVVWSFGEPFTTGVKRGES